MSLSVCRSHISRSTWPNFTQFSIHVTVAVDWPSSDDNAIVEDAMFSHNGANRPESETRVSSSSPGGGVSRRLLRHPAEPGLILLSHNALCY